MIVWNEKLRRSEDVIKAVINQLYKENVSTDGVAESFNDGKEQGCVLKIFDKYNPVLDICFWIYLPSDRVTNNEMKVIVGKHLNCNEKNMWIGDDLEEFEFGNPKAREMHKEVRDFIIDYVKKNLYKTREMPSI